MHVPAEIAVVGCDDIMVAGLLSPALITIRVPKHEVGASAASMLLDRIRGRRGESEVLLKPELIVRENAPRLHDSSRTNRGREDR